MVSVKTSTLCSLFRAQATATVGSCPRWSVTTVETMGLAAATATVAAKWVAKITATPLVRPSSTSWEEENQMVNIKGCVGERRKPQQWQSTHCLGSTEIKKQKRNGSSYELRHTDNTTLVPPRLPDTLPQVYHRRRPTLGLLILPSVSPFPPTIRRTASIYVLPIEQNLAKHARISAINLDDYQLDPLTPPPSPSSPFSMAAYQRMIAETNPT
ncbi:hypothetical protein Tco_1159790 [Tanacetum coccineum]